jgi:hypothetical protein
MKKLFKNKYEERELCLKERVTKEFKELWGNNDYITQDLAIKARNYLEIHHIPHRYLSFFSKHRFYENLAILSLVNIFIIWIIYIFPNRIFLVQLTCLKAFILSVLSFVFSVIFWKLSAKFWFYSCNEIYSKFLIVRSHKCKEVTAHTNCTWMGMLALLQLFIA